MIYFAIVVFSCVAITLLVLQAAVRGRTAAVRDMSELENRTQRVDLAAFQALIDPRDEAFLRANLSARDFRRLQRQRASAAADYVCRMSHNASVMLRLGEAARRSPDTEVARAGVELVDKALHLRLLALAARLRFALDLLVPGRHAWAAGFADSYGQLVSRVVNMAASQSPSRAGRIAASL